MNNVFVLISALVGLFCRFSVSIPPKCSLVSDRTYFRGFAESFGRSKSEIFVKSTFGRRDDVSYENVNPYIELRFSGGQCQSRMVLNMQAKSSGSGGKGQKHKPLAPHYSPKTANQKTYCKLLADPDVSIVLGVGPAGTGKTLFACNEAIQSLKRGDIQKIVLTRPVVSVEEELGFLPGNLVMKMDPWTRPIFDILLEFYSQKDVDAMVQSGVIEISPLAYMRGRTFKRAFIIADEMQNSSPNQMMMLTTRIGEGSKMVITGDLKQSDRAVENGLLDLMRKLQGYRTLNSNELRIRSVEMGTADVERSAVVKQVLALYDTPAHQVKAFDDAKASVNTSVNTSDDVKTSVNVSVKAFDDANTSVKANASVKAFDDDAALIPKKHMSRHEDFNEFSSGKWSGW